MEMYLTVVIKDLLRQRLKYQLNHYCKLKKKKKNKKKKDIVTANCKNVRNCWKGQYSDEYVVKSI